MIDYCTSKRIFSFVIALIIFSVLIFFVEEIAEESDALDMSIKQLQKPHKGKCTHSEYILITIYLGMKKEHANHSSNDCWLREPFVVLQSCLPCSDFEVRAIKAKHCLPTGFFDRLNCSQSNVLVLRPCVSKKPASFYWFVALNVVALTVSCVAATKRKEHLDRHAYMRVGQQLE